MAKTVAVIGIDPVELGWIRILLFLLRHPDPLMAEMLRQALRYLERNASLQVREAAQIDQVR